uniref:uncharacterized protein LOC122607744 isoform X2 n=1 Tax=Erigeron canadensis TaxID=72917 RepID=UPI001CB902F5|nr:uncharacterized protein LOC122607744 isoform X2 [Erigeron canadensis]
MDPKGYLRVTHQDSNRVTQLIIPPQPPQALHSFYEDCTLKGIRVDRFQPGFISCSFTVPSRLTDRNGDMAVGAIANLVDEIGASVIYEKDAPMPVSVDMSISYLSNAKLNVSCFSLPLLIKHVVTINLCRSHNLKRLKDLEKKSEKQLSISIS